MSTLSPTAARLAAIALVFVVFVSIAPASAHEGQTSDAVTVLARVDGHFQGLTLESAGRAVALQASAGRELHLIDLAASTTPATAIDFDVARTGGVRLEVLDLAGNVVRTLADGTWASGQHTLAWHHDSESGEALEGGLFVVRLVQDRTNETLITAR